MTDVLVRNIPEKTHHELKRRAKANGRSVNAEILARLDIKEEPEKRVGLGTQLQEWKKKVFGDDMDFTFEVVRDKTPARFVDFSGPEYDEPESE
ncbi:MAG TPA: Arc family DNA-binding protein [Acidobacteriaceae bacterium]|nr:Arc family DNA-binding protein [Acidobacteriaceae bacterium]